MPQYLKSNFQHSAFYLLYGKYIYKLIHGTMVQWLSQSKDVEGHK